MPSRILHLYFLTLAVTAVSHAQAPVLGKCTIFPADNIWNTPVDALPVSSNSTTYINTIGSSAPLHADFGAGTWNGGPIGIPFVTAPGTQTKYPATFLYSSESDVGPYAVALNAPIEGGSNSTGDRHAISVDVDNCILYELYRAFPQTARWNADSGAIFDLKSSVLRPATWTSADAAGLPIMPGLARYDEVASGEIRHALRFTVPNTLRAFVWPARHYASSFTNPIYPPMGQRFRLKASFDISPYPADVQVILRALKKYGMMIADNGSAWFISGAPDSRWNDNNLSTMRNITGAAFEAVDVSTLMVDPNSGQAKQAGPVAGTVTPSSGNGSSQSFTFTYSDASGYGALTDTYALFNGTVNGAGACFVVYDKPSNSFYLYNDVGNGITGPLAPGGGTTLSNSQCTLNGNGSSVSGSGNTLTMILNLNFNSSLGGSQNIFLYAADNLGLNSGWQNRGTWTVPAASAPPTGDSVSPNAGGALNQSFAFQYSSVNGFAYLNDVYALFNGTVNGAGACFVVYDKPSNGFYLYNDTGTGTIGPLSPGAGTLSNAQCTLNGTGSSVSGSGGTLTMILNLAFNTSFAGAKNIFMYAFDRGGLASGWQNRGMWTVP